MVDGKRPGQEMPLYGYLRKTAKIADFGEGCGKLGLQVHF